MVNRYNQFYTRVRLDVLAPDMEQDQLPQIKELKDAVRKCISIINDELKPILLQAELKQEQTAAAHTLVDQLCASLVSFAELFKMQEYTQPLTKQISHISRFLQIYLIENKADSLLATQSILSCFEMLSKSPSLQIKKQFVSTLNEIFTKSSDLSILKSVMIILTNLAHQEIKYSPINMETAMVQKCRALYQVGLKCLNLASSQDPFDHEITLGYLTERQRIEHVVEWDSVKLSEMADENGVVTVLKLREWLKGQDDVEYKSILDGQDYLVNQQIYQHVEVNQLNNILKAKAALLKHYANLEDLVSAFEETMPALLVFRCSLYYHCDSNAWLQFQMETWKLLVKILKERDSKWQPLIMAALEAVNQQPMSQHQGRSISQNPEFELISKHETEELLTIVLEKIDEESERASKMKLVAFAQNVINSQVYSANTSKDLIEKFKKTCIEQIHQLCLDWTAKDLCFEFVRMIKWSYEECKSNERKQKTPLPALLSQLKGENLINEAIQEGQLARCHQFILGMKSLAQTPEQTEQLETLYSLLLSKCLSMPIGSFSLNFLSNFMTTEIKAPPSPELTANFINYYLQKETFLDRIKGKPSNRTNVKQILDNVREETIKEAVLTVTGPYSLEYLDSLLVGDAATLVEGVRWIAFVTTDLNSNQMIKDHLKHFSLIDPNDQNVAIKEKFVDFLDLLATSEELNKKEKQAMMNMTKSLIDKDYQGEFSSLLHLVLKRHDSLTSLLHDALFKQDIEQTKTISTKLDFYSQILLTRCDRLQKIQTINLEAIVKVILKIYDNLFANRLKKRQNTTEESKPQEAPLLAECGLQPQVLQNLIQLVQEMKHLQNSFLKQSHEQKYQEDKDRILFQLVETNCMIMEAVKSQLDKATDSIDTDQVWYTIQIISLLIYFDYLGYDQVGRCWLYHDFVLAGQVSKIIKLTVAYFSYLETLPTEQKKNLEKDASQLISAFEIFAFNPDKVRRSDRLEQVVIEKNRYKGLQQFKLHQLEQYLEATQDAHTLVSIYSEYFLSTFLKEHLRRVASGFSCYGLKEEAAPKEVKFHNNEENIMAIVMMGLAERKNARKALKLTGNLQNAITFILESGEVGLNEVEVSDEEVQQQPMKVAEEKDGEIETISVEEFNLRARSAQDKMLDAVCASVQKNPCKVKANNFKEYTLELIRCWKPTENSNQQSEGLIKTVIAVAEHLGSQLTNLDPNQSTLEVFEATSIVYDTIYELLYQQSYSEQSSAEIQIFKEEFKVKIHQLLAAWHKDSGQEAIRFCISLLEAKSEQGFKTLTSFISLLHQLLNFALVFIEPILIQKETKWLKEMKGEPIKETGQSEHGTKEYMQPLFNLCETLLPHIPDSQECLKIVTKNLSQISLFHLLSYSTQSSLQTSFNSFLSQTLAPSHELTLLQQLIHSPLEHAALKHLILCSINIKEFKQRMFKEQVSEYDPREYSSRKGESQRVWYDCKQLINEILHDIKAVKDVYTEEEVKNVVEAVGELCEVQGGKSGLEVRVKQGIEIEHVKLPVVQFKAIVEMAKKLGQEEHIGKDGKLPMMAEVQRFTQIVSEFLLNSKYFDFVTPKNMQEYQDTVVQMVECLAEHLLPNIFLLSDQKGAFLYNLEQVDVLKAINIFTGTGFYALDWAKKFKGDLRQRLIQNAIRRTKERAELSDFKEQDLKQLSSDLDLIIHFSDNFNKFESNRMLLSATNYTNALTYLLQPDADILSLVSKLQSSFSKCRPEDHFVLQRTCLSQCVRIQEIVYRHLIGVKIRQNQVEQDQKRKKNLQEGKPNESGLTAFDLILENKASQCKQCPNQSSIECSSVHQVTELLQSLQVINYNPLHIIESRQQDHTQNKIAQIFPKPKTPQTSSNYLQQLLTGFQYSESMRPLRDSHTSVLKAWIHAQNQAHVVSPIDASKVVAKMVGELEAMMKEVQQVRAGGKIQAKEQVVQEVRVEEEKKEEMMYGYPVSFLRENQVEPEMLEFLPEEMRIEILSGLDKQFREWQAQHQKPVAEVRQNSEQEPVLNDEPVMDLDAETREIIELGLDPEFLSSLPLEMRQELINNARQELHQAAQNMMPAEIDIATLIEIQQDPQLRREMLQNLSQDQINDLPPRLRTEAINFLRGHNIERDEEIEEEQQEQREREQQRHIGGLGMHKKIIANPETLNLSELLFSYSQELGQYEFDQFCKQYVIGEIQMIDDSNLLAVTLLNPSHMSCDLIGLFKSKSLFHNLSNPTNPSPYFSTLLQTLIHFLEVSATQDINSLLTLCTINLSKIKTPSRIITSFNFHILLAAASDLLMHMAVRYPICVREYLGLNSEQEESLVQSIIRLFNLLVQREQEMTDQMVTHNNQNFDYLIKNKAKLQQVIKVVLHCFNHQFESGSANWQLVNQETSRPRLETLFKNLTQLIKVKNIQIQDEYAAITANISSSDRGNWQMMLKEIGYLQEDNLAILNDYCLQVLMKMTELGIDANEPGQAAVELNEETVNEIRQELIEMFNKSKPFIDLIELQRSLLAKVSQTAKNTFKSIQELNGKNETEQVATLQQKLDYNDSLLRDVLSVFSSGNLEMLVSQLTQILAAHRKQSILIDEQANTLLLLVIESFMPELEIGVINAKEREQIRRSFDKTLDSKYVQMEPVKAKSKEDKIVAEQIPIGKELSTHLSKQWSSKVFGDIDSSSDGSRLAQLAVILQSNRSQVNSFIKGLCEGNECVLVPGKLDQFEKYMLEMPWLIDFEVKQLLFGHCMGRIKNKVSRMNRLNISVRRNQIFQDAYAQISHLRSSDFMQGTRVEFSGEGGMDAGGLTREFYTELSKQLFNQNYSLFRKSDNGSTYMPNSKSYVQAEHIGYFKFVGKIIAKAILDDCLLECYFVKSIYKYIVGQKLRFKDLEDFDHDLYVGLDWMLNAKDPENVEVLYETFCIEEDYFGKSQVIDLIPNGREVDVTFDTRELYVEKKAYYTLYKTVQRQIDSFLEGFYEIIPFNLISIYNYKELELVISGLPDFNMEDLKKSTTYYGYNEQSPQIVWFWEFMTTLDRTQKCNFLQFLTGSSKVPVDGFNNLQGMSGPTPPRIIKANGNYRLPEAHTCFNQLDLPEYGTKEELESKMRWAISESSGFGFG